MTASEHEVAAVIPQMKRKKAAGMDSIKAEALIEGKEVIGEHITRIFNRCLNGKIPMPEEWRQSIYWPIHKKKD